MIQYFVNAALQLLGYKKTQISTIQPAPYTNNNSAQTTINLNLNKVKLSGNEIVLLDVPFEEKDEVKVLGARWHPEMKRWFITFKQDRYIFDKWLLKQPKNSGSIIITGDLFLLRSHERCYRCSKQCDVFCLGASSFLDQDTQYDLSTFCTFNFLDFVPEKMLTLLTQYTPTYFLDYTKQSDQVYYTNHCTCGAKLGDFFLHNEPGGAFNPISEIDGKHSVIIHPIITNETIRISAGYVSSDVLRFSKTGNSITL